MQLKVKDAARLLNVSEKTIYRWVSQGKIPGHRISDQYRFNRAELLEWASAHQLRISPEILKEPETVKIPLLEEALRAGGIYYRLEGSDKISVLRNAVGIIPLPDEVDREFLLQVLLARESVGSTGIGNGIAIPHVRNPIVMHISRPMISLCFLKNAVDFDAVDGKPVHTLFTIVSPTIKAHLNLLSKLAFGLKSSGFAESVSPHASREKLFQEARLLDAFLARKTS
jgi:PTS system nitrogen regulatory IIA component